MLIIRFKNPGDARLRPIGTFLEWQIPPNLLKGRHRCPRKLGMRHFTLLEIVAIGKRAKSGNVNHSNLIQRVQFACKRDFD
jgi:hypothetical protein